MLKKILEKLGLSSVVYKLERCYSRNTRDYAPSSLEDAYSYLGSLYDRSMKSCIVEHTPIPYDCDLEIIVPCYNVEKYVEECIDSILNQETRYSFFLTIVNDGSKDGTRSVLQKYENIKNVKIIDQHNKGFSGARNTGISQAHGKYLIFVDSDDVLMPGAIEHFMTLAFKTDADVVDGGHIRFADRTGNNGIISRIKADIYDLVQRPQTLPYNEKSPGITGYPWGKVLKAELFHRVQFPEGFWFEDTLIWMIVAPLCKRMATTDFIAFRYRMNPDSISHQASSKIKSLDSLFITLQLLKDRERLGIEFDQDQYDMLLRQMRMNFCRVQSLPEKIKQAVFTVQQDLIVNRFKDWTTSNQDVKPIENFMEQNDYNGFRLWCKWH